MDEVWLPIAGYEGLYEASSLGRVRSLRPPRGDGIMRGCVDRGGYRTVQLTKDGHQKRHKVHRLICSAFKGPPPAGTECGHRNGQRHDNSAGNLEWISKSENVQDSIRHGTHRFLRPVSRLTGERHQNTRLSDAQVQEMRSDRSAGMSERALARKYGVSQSHVHRIVVGKNRNMPSGFAPSPFGSRPSGFGH